MSISNPKPAAVAPARKRNARLYSIIIIVVLVIAAIGGAYYYVASAPKSSAQTFTFGLEGSDAEHVTIIDALNHVSQFGPKASVQVISDPTSLTSAGSNGQLDMFEFQFPTTTINAIEVGANLVAIGEDSTAFLQDLVVSSSIQTFTQSTAQPWQPLVSTDQSCFPWFLLPMDTIIPNLTSTWS